jgi:monoterpene epsilon-lactone hydrolase
MVVAELLPERAGRPPTADLEARRAGVGASLSALPRHPGAEVDEVDAGGVLITRTRPTTDSTDTTDTTLLYFHGGGYRLGSSTVFASYNTYLAAVCGITVLSVDYRLAPENPFPAGLNDALTAYHWALEQVGAGALLVGGDSAGGGLAAALMLRIAATGLPQPAALVLLSPWVDLRVIAASFDECGPTDQMFSRSAAQEAADMYLGEYPADDVLVSPLLGDWAGLPPVLIQASNSEVLRDDAVQLAAKIRDAGGSVELSIYPDVPHVWHLAAPGLDAANRAIDEIAAFIARETAEHQESDDDAASR